MNTVFLITVLLAVQAKALPRAGCSVKIDGGLGNPTPLLLHPQTDRILYPLSYTSKNLTFAIGQTLKVACHGSQVTYSGKTISNDSQALLKCVGNSVFQESSAGRLQLQNVNCVTFPVPNIRDTKEACGNGTGFSVQSVGFGLKGKPYQTVLDVCHNRKLSLTSWSHAEIVPSLNAAQHGLPRPAFETAGYFAGINMNEAYKRKTQRETFTKILGSARLAEQYIQSTGDVFLARGHLVANADFVYGAMQRSTFKYINTVPQYQTINGGNWATVEADVRTLAKTRNVTLHQWTGGIGVLSLPDAKGVEREMYLHVAKNGAKQVPVPKLMFKALHDYKSQASVVLLSVNHPFLKTLPKDYVLCKDICHKLRYLTWKPKDTKHGLSYCCEMDDFRRSYRGLPNFHTSGLLV